jgi:hypothetical protein
MNIYTEPAREIPMLPAVEVDPGASLERLLELSHDANAAVRFNPVRALAASEVPPQTEGHVGPPLVGVPFFRPSASEGPTGKSESAVLAEQLNAASVTPPCPGREVLGPVIVQEGRVIHCALRLVDEQRETGSAFFRELFPHLRAHGQTRFMVDSDGHNGAVLDRFIDLGMNGLFPFEVAAGYDIREVRKQYPRFFIWGGLDKRVLNGSRDDIKREVMEKVPAVWASGGFIPSLDHSCQPCPQENFEYYLELLRGLCK